MRNRLLSKKGRLAFYRAMLSELIHRFNTSNEMGFCLIVIAVSNRIESTETDLTLDLLPELYRHKPTEVSAYWYPRKDFKSRYEALRLTIFEMEEEASHLKFWQRIKWDFYKI
jgi:hypothetical protein